MCKATELDNWKKAWRWMTLAFVVQTIAMLGQMAHAYIWKHKWEVEFELSSKLLLQLQRMRQSSTSEETSSIGLLIPSVTRVVELSRKPEKPNTARLYLSSVAEALLNSGKAAVCLHQPFQVLLSQRRLVLRTMSFSGSFCVPNTSRERL